MSDWIGHECGIAAIRLLKPFEYYVEKYGSASFAINRLYLLMEKQHNRGQDGAGAVVVKLDTDPGNPFIFRALSADKDPIAQVHQHMLASLAESQRDNPEHADDPVWLKRNAKFAGELLLGHLRYGTRGRGGVSYCHPFLRQSNWKNRNLVLAGNFNLTNNDELFDTLVELGQHPRSEKDTVMVLEKIGHFLDEENDRLFREFRKQGLERPAISEKISDNLDLLTVLKRAVKNFDGGYTMAGIIGNGDLFVMRDACGIRPGFFYQDDEFVVVASERPAIQTAFNVPVESVQEIKPGHALVVRKNGQVLHEQISDVAKVSPCSFERIYFSRGTDKDIYNERKQLGRQLTEPVLKAVDYDLDHTVFSYIPNTAETAFMGLIEGVKAYVADRAKHHILTERNLSAARITELVNYQPRIEKIMTKDAKLRTFITTDADRNELVSMVYDTTYGVVKSDDTLVVLDDSIVRGTTLRESILRILDRLHPRKIVIVSSAPEIRYPDCYGIDMSKSKDFVAFQAAIALVKETGREALLTEVYEKCKASLDLPCDQVVNEVKAIFRLFRPHEVEEKIAQILRPADLKADFEVIYQSIEGLHAACPNHKGDWYFSGNYPTSGGNRVVNRSFVNFMENSDARAY
ncbi:MAG: amidophosphoribosyltransferase [Verrucomicrobia bacterium]|nr:amidophosphoribosyltransferase [Verrucomicrobiota bacterium]